MLFNAPLLAAAFCLSTSPVLAAASPLADALPMVGTGGHGHTYPGATVPFGFVQASPDTRNQGWDACSGYHYSDSTIMGFSHTHLSGTGCTALGDLLIMPVTGDLNDPAGYQPLKAERFKSAFSHDNEVAQPGYYRVLLDKYNVLAELTATPHAAMHRYTFPASSHSHLLVDLVYGIGDHPTDAELTVAKNNLITGYRRVDGWAKGRMIYFAVETSKPFKDYGLEVDDQPLLARQADARGKNVRAHLDFKTSKGQQILLRVGLSPTSVEEAVKNLRAEIPSWDFDAVRAAAQISWSENLSRIQIESSNPDIRQT
ncbi:MAG TPA: glycoside hydrolase domain-containing protein, partial [Acetobacteraceae bacterium]|nr:glycoside hydrolase domain-containing protein [Acetobacteraceae bacterium]